MSTTVTPIKKWLIHVSETIDHCYEVEAENEEQALEAYYRLSDEQLESADLDGGRNWDTPWSVEESE